MQGEEAAAITRGPIGAILSNSRDQLLSRLQTLAAATWLCVPPEIVWEVCTHRATRQKFLEIAERLLGEMERIRDTKEVIVETAGAKSDTRAPKPETTRSEAGGLF